VFARGRRRSASPLSADLAHHAYRARFAAQVLQARIRQCGVAPRRAASAEVGEAAERLVSRATVYALRKRGVLRQCSGCQRDADDGGGITGISWVARQLANRLLTNGAKRTPPRSPVC